MSVRYIVGDVLEVLRSMPDASVDLVLSSPPFLALRSYLPSDHPDKAKEIGSEPTPGAFIDTLLDVVEECRRVLAPHGSLCFELGDTYAGSGGGGGDYLPGGLRENQPGFGGSAEKAREGDAAHWRQKNEWKQGGLATYSDQRGNPDGMRDTTFSGANTRSGGGAGWPLDKSLCLVPELLRIAMVYGVNPLTGRSTPRWRARNVVRWCRPNPPVGALGDKVRPATSDIIVACVDRKRYFDLDAIRHDHVKPGHPQKPRPSRNPHHGWTELPSSGVTNPAGAPPLDHWWFDEDTFDQDAWHVSTEPYRGSHYATWPTDLCVRPILAMCPSRVCTTCGQPSERITERESFGVTSSVGSTSGGLSRLPKSVVGYRVPENATVTTTGWTDCGHETWRQGVVLDPFAGSGTTLLVAHGHGRSAIGVDLDARNADLARERVGMWLEVEHHKPAEATA